MLGALHYFTNFKPFVSGMFLLWQAQEEMAWRIAKMIVNDVMQQAQCEQRSEKITKVRGWKSSVPLSGLSQRGRSRALAVPPVVLLLCKS